MNRGKKRLIAEGTRAWTPYKTIATTRPPSGSTRLVPRA